MITPRHPTDYAELLCLSTRAEELERNKAARRERMTEEKDTEDFHEGVSFAIERLAGVLGINPSKFCWDAATETFEGDVDSVISNCLSATPGGTA